MKSIRFARVNEFADVTDGVHQSLPFIEDGEVKILSAKHPKENYIDLSSFETVSEEYHALNPRTALRENDVIISTVGTIGNSAVVTREVLPANSDRHIGIIRIREKSMNPFFLSTFLLSKFGRVQSLAESTGNVQLNLFISKIDTLIVPRFSADFEERIASIVKTAYETRESSKAFALQAESLLLSELGLEHWQPPEALTYERSSKDVFGAGRLDAEYYHPAKKAALNHIYQSDFIPLKELFVSVRELWNPLDFQSSARAQNYDLTAALSPFLDPDQPPTEASEIGSTKKTFSQGDLVVSRLRSYLKEIATVTHESNWPMVGSSEFIVLRPTQELFSSDALGLYLRSLLPQIILKWSQDGANHPRFSENELLNLPIPQSVIDLNDRLTGIALRIREAHIHSAQLLEAAKRAVEIAIEDSEAAALAYLNAQAGNSGT